MSKNSTEMYEKARQLWEEGELDEAEIVYRQLIALDPKFTYAFYDLGVLLQESKPEAKDEIRTYLERFIKLAKSDTSLREQVISAQETIEGLSSAQHKKIDLTGRWKHPLLGGRDGNVLLVQVKQEHEKIKGILSKRFFLEREGRYIHEGRRIFEGKIDGMAGKVSWSHQYNDDIYLSDLIIENEDYFSIGKHYSFFRLDHSDTIINADPKAAELAEINAKKLAERIGPEIRISNGNIDHLDTLISLKEGFLSRPRGMPGRPKNIFERNKLQKELDDLRKQKNNLTTTRDKKLAEFEKALKDYPDLVPFYSLSFKSH